MPQEHQTNRWHPNKLSNHLTKQSARRTRIKRSKHLYRVQANMRQSGVQKDARSKVQPPVVKMSVEISRLKRQPHSQTAKTFHTEIRRRDCHRPKNADSGAANDLRTNCAPCRRTQAAPTIHNRRSKKRLDYAIARSGRRTRRLRWPKTHRDSFATD